MAHQIISITKIQQQAEQAAKKHAAVHDACPYEAGTDAAATFEQAFNHAKEAMKKEGAWIAK